MPLVLSVRERLAPPPEADEQSAGDVLDGPEVERAQDYDHDRDAERAEDNGVRAVEEQRQRL